jgi:hypothetical protein
MPDSLKNDLVTVEYVAGEQPTHTKLTQSITQLKTAVERLNKAIGDLYSGQTHTGSSGSYSIDYLNSVGPNISRFVGSAGWLNPKRFSRTLQTLTVTFAGHNSFGGGTPKVNGFDHYNRREFKLPFPPIRFTSTEGAGDVSIQSSWDVGGGWVIGSPGAGYTDVSATKVTTRRNSLSSVDATGEYHVSDDGVITTYDPIDDPGTPEGFTVTYQFHMVPDRYDGASQNVIPDFSQTSNLCAVSLVSGSTYQIVLPTLDSIRAWPDLTTWYPYDELLTFDKPTSGVHSQDGDQLLLPFALRNNLSNGDIIPDGYIYLWNETTDEIVDGVTFTYVNTYTVNCSGQTLTVGSSTYRIVVPGTTIGQTLSYLCESSRAHNHSGIYASQDGTFLGERVRHFDLLNNIDEGSENKGGFVHSEAGPTRNQHPHYLHRYGYQFGESISDSGNVSNAMLGDLVFSNTSGALSLSASSYSLYFGQYGSPSPSIYYDNAVDSLTLGRKDVLVEKGLVVQDGISTSTSGQKILFEQLNHTLTSGNISDGWCNVIGSLNGIGHAENEEYVVSITGTGRDVTGTDGYALGNYPTGGVWELYVVNYTLSSSSIDVKIIIGTNWAAGDLIRVLVHYLPA